MKQARWFLQPLGWLIVRANHLARRWWPLIASLGIAAVLYTMGYVVITVAEDRAQLRDQRDAFDDQSAQLGLIIERNERFDSQREQRLDQAVSDVEDLIIDHMARHDENVALKLNETLHRIASLLDRPAGTPPNPVNAVGPQPGQTAPAHTPAPSSRQPPTTAPAPPSAPRPPPAPTTTTPDQKSCAKRPNGPRC